MVTQHIDTNKYTPYIIHIEGTDWHAVCEQHSYPIDKNDFSFSAGNNKISFDGVFMAIHGTPGEDGILQAYFDLLNIPYNCCGSFEASLTFNKGMCNSLLKNFNITSAKAIMINKEEAYDTQTIENNIGLPCFVKPNRSGSSFGVSKVTASEQWEQAIKEAFKYDNQVLIEAFIDGIEVTCGLIENEGELIALPLTEITTENDFFDYEAKYKGKSHEITPARVSNEIKEQVQSISKKIYNTLRLKGLIRMDYIVEKDQAYLIEINTIPGLSEESIIPQQAACYGISLKELFSLTLENMFTHD
ncbi:MAG: D-alanine--D-alanine ligase [Cryomorphaceae bacterium]|nr:MAG: D-alanine--D-alanine ligase [Cryomorphaceae bacterium]